MMRLNSNTQVREILTSSALSGVLDGVLVMLYLGVMLLVRRRWLAVVAWRRRCSARSSTCVRARQQRELARKYLQADAKAQSYQVELLTSMRDAQGDGLRAARGRALVAPVRRRAQHRR